MILYIHMSKRINIVLYKILKSSSQVINLIKMKSFQLFYTAVDLLRLSFII